MMASRPVFHLALITLEATTAHAIHSGAADQVRDVVLLRDPNGLPAIPGTSLAGVLRHQFEIEQGAELTRQLFGYVDGDQGHVSALQVGWGLLHDSQDCPREGLLSDLATDPMLNWLMQPHPITRDRVKLDCRGTAKDTAKYDTTLVPAGARYSTLVGFWSQGTEQDEAAWQALLSLFASPLFRLGHGTRNGAGAFQVAAARAARWDLRTPEGRQGYQDRPRTRHAAKALPTVPLTTTNSALSVTLSLQSESGWRIGAGDDLLGLSDDEAPDLMPQSEACILWQQGRAQISKRRALLPATAVKGALAHRFAYHYRRLTGDWVEHAGTPQDAHDSEAVKALFGFATESDGSGQAGLLVIDDVLLAESQVYTQMHNRIDHFTGGVMSGALFNEGLLWQTPIELTIHLLPGERLDALGAAQRQALNATLDDLAQGWLPLGAGGSRGIGMFLGVKPPRWSDDGQWINGQVTEAA